MHLNLLRDMKEPGTLFRQIYQVLLFETFFSILAKPRSLQERRIWSLLLKKSLMKDFTFFESAILLREEFRVT